MLTLEQQFDLIQDPRFHQRIQMAAWKYALVMVNETPGTVKRKQWGKAALLGALDTDVMRGFSIRVVSTPAVSAVGKSVDDDTLQAAVDAAVTDIAG